MRRTRIDPAVVAGYDNLADAALKAARGKRSQPEVRDFFERFDDYLVTLANAIRMGGIPLGGYRCFMIYDPKTRLIHAPTFPDRMIHHALMNLMTSTFERTEISSSFACRPGEGLLAAANAAKRAIRHYPWYAKIDIQGYFDHIDQEILLGLLARRFKGQDGLALLRRIVVTIKPCRVRGCGSVRSQTEFRSGYLVPGS